MIGTLWAGGAGAGEQDVTLQRWAASLVPLDALPAVERDAVRQVLEQPTLFGQGPSEVFNGRPALYHWLQEHPDRAAAAWRRLGAKCLPIEARPAGRFGWSDGQGSDLSWKTIHESHELRIWYAEGKVRPAPLLPQVPFRAVVVLRHLEGTDAARRTLIHQQADLFVQTDSKMVTLATHLLGASAPRLLEQCLAQLELFFSGLVWYLERHPDRAVALGIPLGELQN